MTEKVVSRCWRDMTKPCENMKCCYDASCKAVFEYWKFSNSKEWKRMVAEELRKEKVRV